MLQSRASEGWQSILPPRLTTSDPTAKTLTHLHLQPQNFLAIPSIGNTAVKSNALAELMNRASKIHWKNLS